jgi:excisionase family DNA binding protein
MQQPLISVKQAARQFSVSLSFIYRNIQQGLPSYRVGSDIRLDEAECRAHFRQKAKKKKS